MGIGIIFDGVAYALKGGDTAITQITKKSLQDQSTGWTCSSRRS